MDESDTLMKKKKSGSFDFKVREDGKVFVKYLLLSISKSNFNVNYCLSLY